MINDVESLTRRLDAANKEINYLKSEIEKEDDYIVFLEQSREEMKEHRDEVTVQNDMLLMEKEALRRKIEREEKINDNIIKDFYLMVQHGDAYLKVSYCNKKKLFIFLRSCYLPSIKFKNEC